MTEPPASRATAADALLALAVLGVRTGLGAGAVVVRVVRPAGERLWYADRWPNETLRLLAEAGLRQRRQVQAEALRLYRKVAPAVVTDLIDQLDLDAIARDVLAEIDLPEIVQTSVGAVVSENVRGVRVNAYRVDGAVSRWVDRALRRDG